TRLRRTKNFFLMGLRTGWAMVCLLILSASLAAEVAGRLGRGRGGRGRRVRRVGHVGTRPARFGVARHLEAVLDLLVDPDGEEPQDALRKAHFALDFGDTGRRCPEQEVVVRRLGPLLDGVGETAAAHRLVLFDRRAVVDEELAELVDDGEGSRLVLFGDDEKDHVVLALRIRGGHGVSSFWIAPAFAGREARPWTSGPVPSQGCGSPAGRRTGVDDQFAGSSSGERLKRFMAASMPSVTKTVRASHADAIAPSTSGRSFFEKRESTYVSSGSPSWKFSPRTPRRRRGMAFVPKQSITDCSPFWPPEEPDRRRRIVPTGRAVSSDTTMSRSGPTSYFAASPFTDSPEAFMYVWGLATITGRSPTLTRPVSARQSRRSRRGGPPAALWANACTTSKPTLCRVPEYRSPGLPSPTTRTSSSVPISFPSSRPLVRPSEGPLERPRRVRRLPLPSCPS